LDHYSSDYYVSRMCLATVLLTLIDGVCSFIFPEQPCRKTHHGRNTAWQYQDSSGSNYERMVV